MGKLTPGYIRSVIERHDAKWDQERSRLKMYRNAYETNFWQGNKDDLQVETSRAYEYIEGYLAALFSKNPAVKVQAGIRGRGNNDKAQQLVNHWLIGIRRVLEDVTRLALIYPNAAVKLSPRIHQDVYSRVDVSIIAPWDLILDEAANTWDMQRFIGHRYWVTAEVAKQRWGDRAGLTPLSKKEFLKGSARYYGERDLQEQFIQAVEVYDKENDRMYVWSEQLYDGETSWLYDGMDVPSGVEGEVKRITKIPFRTADDSPVVPIVPVYYNRMPDRPLVGYSAMSRIYDQVREYNILRTFQAQAVRKASRQWMVRSGSLSPDNMSRIAEGEDGAFIEVDIQPGHSLAEVVSIIPQQPTPLETYQYLNAVQQDFERGSVLAPFTRGDATKATATEVRQLAAYSSSEIGRLARERDAVVEQIASVYLNMIRFYLKDGRPDMIELNGKIQVISNEDLSGAFRIFSQDSGSTPISDEAKKIELMKVIPLLVSLGVPKSKIIEVVVRQYGLPADFAEAARQGGVGEPAAGGVAALESVRGATPVSPATGAGGAA